jgi:hypothetical protein
VRVADSHEEFFKEKKQAMEIAEMNEVMRRYRQVMEDPAWRSEMLENCSDITAARSKVK